LLVFEAVNAPPGQADFAKLLDLIMLVLLTGRERTEAEFRELFGAAGFCLTRAIQTRPGIAAIIEGVPPRTGRQDLGGRRLVYSQSCGKI